MLREGVGMRRGNRTAIERVPAAVSNGEGSIVDNPGRVIAA